jgi:hypothetical protein
MLLPISATAIVNSYLVNSYRVKYSEWRAVEATAASRLWRTRSGSVFVRIRMSRSVCAISRRWRRIVWTGGYYADTSDYGALSAGTTAFAADSEVSPAHPAVEAAEASQHCRRAAWRTRMIPGSNKNGKNEHNPIRKKSNEIIVSN